MIIPQFSLRWLLGLMALCGGISLILAFANRGQTWALGMTAAIGGVFLLFLLYEATFSAASLITQASKAIFGRSPPGDSPFAIKPPEPSPFAESPMTESPPAISS
jgi:hypothetical protein